MGINMKIFGDIIYNKNRDNIIFVLTCAKVGKG